tara:strand:+ start:88 stop:375 length:288 start_codon:yes stop_codon:yes gene_type:complete
MGGRAIQDGVDNTQPKCLFIIGQQGCGKSTLIRRLTGEQDIVTDKGAKTVTKVIKPYEMKGRYSKWTVYDSPGINGLRDCNNPSWNNEKNQRNKV